MEQYVSVQIKKAARLFVQAANVYLQKSGITHTQSIYLIRLWKQDGQSQRQLCESAGTAQPTVVKILDRLERDGLINREPNPKDRRGMLLYLTPKAKKICVKLENTVEEIEDMACDKINLAQLKKLNVDLNAITQNLEHYLSTVGAENSKGKHARTHKQA